MHSLVNCVITGATGFIGRSLAATLQQNNYSVVGCHQGNALFSIKNNVPDSMVDQWENELQHIDVVIHTAGLAHQIGEDAAAAEQRYALVNADATVRLATAAEKAGVKRFIFISSAKVFGEGGACAYTSASPSCPMDSYARSKWRAEQQLVELAQESAMELVIIRPPLVYGPNAKANFGLLQRLAALPFPLPLASMRNQRDLIGIDNLIDLIEICIQHPVAAGGTWLCADSAPYSIADIVMSLRQAANRKPALFHCPEIILRTAVNVTLGKTHAEKVFGDFRVDCSNTHMLLNWQPQRTMKDIYSHAGQVFEC